MIDSIFNLQLFAEGGDGAAPGVSSVPAEGVEGTTGEKTETNVTQGKAEKTFTESEVQAMIQDRLKKSKESEKESKAYRDKTARVFEALAVKYGKNADEIDDIIEAVSKDDDYYRDAAYEKGMGVEEFRQYKQIQDENARYKAHEAEQAQLDRQRQFIDRVNREAMICRSVYPDFDINVESKNEGFRSLVEKGVDVRTAYEISHRDEFIRSAQARAAQDVQKNMQMNAVMNQNRPMENGVRSPAAIDGNIDISKLDRKQMKEYKERARRGEKITFK